MKIFLSHAQKDAVLARQLATKLREEDFDVWTAEEHVIPGDNWAKKVGKALDAADAMVLLFTPNAIDSDSLRNNVDFAIGGKKFENRVFSVMFGPTLRASRDIPWILQRLPHRKVKTAREFDAVAEEVRSLWTDADLSTPMREMFLSHASQDHEFAKRLRDELVDRKISVWFAPHHIGAADKWVDEIGLALDRCDWFAVILTPDAVRSMWVRRELHYALIAQRFDGRILPLLLRQCEIKSLSWVLPQIQMIDFRDDYDVGFRHLLRALRIRRRGNR